MKNKLKYVLKEFEATKTNKSANKLQKKHTKSSNTANLPWSNNHSIDFNCARVIDKGKQRVRKSLESWQTAIKNADNNSKPLPRQYSILFLLIGIFFIGF